MPEQSVNKNTFPQHEFVFSVFVSSLKRTGEPWKLSIVQIDGHINENGEVPDWISECVLRNRIPLLREWKFSFHLIPYDV